MGSPQVGFTRFVQQFRRHKGGMAGLVILMLLRHSWRSVAPIFCSARDDARIQPTFWTTPYLAPPSWSFWLGTDDHGRSVLALICYGARVSLLVGIDRQFHVDGDRHIRRNRQWSLPQLVRRDAADGSPTGSWSSLGSCWQWCVITVVEVADLPPRSLSSGYLVGGNGAAVRAQTLSIEGRPYLERAKVLGTGDWKQMTRHILPNVMPLVLANATLTVSIAILDRDNVGLPRSW